MLKQLKQRKESGFTIIEVLIVLAIAGLIMVIVFLAVPALQRNAHNNQYKTEANNISSAIQEVVANKDGGSLAAGDSQGVLDAANAKTVTTLTINTGAATAYTPSLTSATATTNASCPASMPGTVGTTVTPGAGTTTRSITLMYGIEGKGNGVIAQCIQVQ